MTKGSWVLTLLLVGFLLAGHGAHAADGDFAWANSISASSVENYFGVDLDDSGNVYATGEYLGTVDFDPGAGTVNLTSAGRNAFVQKLDRDGNFIWARNIRGSSQNFAYGIAVDSAGNSYITGFYFGTTDFDPGAGSFSLTSNGGSDSYVVKLDTNGDFVWALSIGSTATDQGRAIAVDDAGNLYAAGTFSGTVDLDPGAGISNFTSSGTTDSYVMKLDSDGGFAWATAISTAGSDQVNAISVDGAGNIWAGGLSGSSGVVVRLNSAGAITGTYTPLVNEVNDTAIDSGGNLYICGYFSGTVDFDPGAGTANLTASAVFTAFVLKLNAAGDYVNAFAIPSTSFSNGKGVEVDGADNLLVTGYANGTSDFDPGAGTVSPTVYGSNDAFIAKYTSAGSLVWARTMGGTSSDLPRAMAVDVQGNAVAAGTYQGSGDYDPGAGTATLAHSGSDDGFMVKLQGPADVTAPLASAVVPATTGPTNAASVAFKVKFSESVQNFDDASDLIITHAGTANTGVTITGGPRVYTATVTGVSGDGSFTAAVSTASGLVDFSGNPLLSSVTSAAVTIDNSGPVVGIGAPSATLVNPLSTVTFPITVTGADTINLTSGDVSISYAGTTFGGTVNVLNGTTANPTVEVTGVGATAAGHYTVSIAAGVASDLAANSSLAAGPSALVFVDGVVPSVVIDAPTGGPISSTTGQIQFPVRAIGANTVNLTVSEVTVNYGGGTSGGVLSVLDGNTAFATVLLSQVSGNGFVTISIDAGVASDTAGNQSAAVGPSASAIIDNTAPSYYNLSATPGTAGAGQVVELEFFTTEFTTTDPEVTVNGNPAVRTAKGAPIYFYSYTVLPSDPAGPASIAISGIDDAANVGSFSNNSALTILPSEQPLPLVAWPLAVVLAAAGGLALRRKLGR